MDPKTPERQPADKPPEQAGAQPPVPSVDAQLEREVTALLYGSSAAERARGEEAVDEARRLESLESDVSEIKRRLASTPSENDVRQGGVNWFKTHLNWTYVLGHLAGFALGLALSLVLVVADPSVSEDAAAAVSVVVWGVVLYPTSAWVLWQKYRSLCWLWLVWWGSPLWLGNRKTG